MATRTTKNTRRTRRTKATAATTSTAPPEATAPNVTQVKPEVLVERIKASNPNFLGKMPDQRAANMVRHTLRALAAEINETDEGRLRVQGLGGVVIRQVEREKDGTTEKVKRVVLRPAQPKA